jgi:hypothetical protein
MSTEVFLTRSIARFLVDRNASRRHKSVLTGCHVSLRTMTSSITLVRTAGGILLFHGRCATAFWSDPEKHGRICELTYVQAFNTSEPDAKKLCSALPHPLLHAIGKQPAPLGALDAEIDALRERLGALDGREPDKIPVA